MNVKTYFQVKEKYRNVFPLFMRNKIREISFIYFCISTLKLISPNKLIKKSYLTDFGISNKLALESGSGTI